MDIMGWLSEGHIFPKRAAPEQSKSGEVNAV